MCESADMRACAAKLRHERLVSAAKFLEFYAAKSCARMGKIYNAFLRGKICGALLASKFCAARCSKIRSVKYYAEFYSAAHGDKIYGVMTDNKILGTALAGVRNFGLKNACVNLRPRNTYADLKFKGSTNSEPAGGLNFKFKNGANSGLLCGNVKPIKPRGPENALSSYTREILASVWPGKILSPDTSAKDPASDESARDLISSDAIGILRSARMMKFLALDKAIKFLRYGVVGISNRNDAAEISAYTKAAGMLSFSVAAWALASILANKILNPNAAGKILSLSAVSHMSIDADLKGASGC